MQEEVAKLKAEVARSKGFGPSQPIPEHTKAQARRIKQQQRSARVESDIGPEAYKPKGKAFRQSKKALKKLAEETRQALVQKAKKSTRERFREFAGIGEMPTSQECWG